MIARLLISRSHFVLTNFIKQDLKKHNLKKNHPDLLYLKKDTKLGINEAKKIKEFFSLKPYSAKRKMVVLEDASILTHEAQNALLKTIEELPKEAILTLGTSSDAALLPTILSRCKIVNLETQNEDTLKHHDKYTKDFEKLISSSIEERFEYIAKLKDRKEFLLHLVYYFQKQLLDSKSRQTLKDFLKELLRAEKWAKQNVNIRAILEYLMLKMPSRE
ncbi:hypothetical protein KKE78_03835 [Patescibacteria group bacterium]|nr:hypothetical protein [Patescibacteria group bacterium]